MPQPVWRQVAQAEVPSPTKPPEEKSRWVLALELAPAGKTMKIEVTGDKDGNKRTWTPKSFSTACSADGDIAGAQKADPQPSSAMPVAGAPRGALIGRIGGSTADNFPPASQGNPVPPAPYVLFPVGRKCVIAVPATLVGSLFLGVNDEQAQMAEVQGSLLVTIYEAV